MCVARSTAVPAHHRLSITKAWSRDCTYIYHAKGCPRPDLSSSDQPFQLHLTGLQAVLCNPPAAPAAPGQPSKAEDQPSISRPPAEPYLNPISPTNPPFQTTTAPFALSSGGAPLAGQVPAQAGLHLLPLLSGKSVDCAGGKISCPQVQAVYQLDPLPSFPLKCLSQATGLPQNLPTGPTKAKHNTCTEGHSSLSDRGLASTFTCDRWNVVSDHRGQFTAGPLAVDGPGDGLTQSLTAACSPGKRKVFLNCWAGETATAVQLQVSGRPAPLRRDPGHGTRGGTLSQECGPAPAPPLSHPQTLPV